MYTCVLCRFDVPLDDAIAPTLSGACVCLRCYDRAVGNERRMPAQLRRQLIDILVAEPVA